LQKSERGPPQTCGLAVDLDVEIDFVGNLRQVLLSLTNQQPNTTVSCLDPDPTDSVIQKLAQASETVISTSNSAQSLIRSEKKKHSERGGRSKSWACGQGTDEVDEHLGERQGCGGEREPQAHRGRAPGGPRRRAPPPPARRHLRSARSSAAADEVERILLDLIVLLHYCSLRLVHERNHQIRRAAEEAPRWLTCGADAICGSHMSV
jgi:hypothetical protein